MIYLLDVNVLIAAIWQALAQNKDLASTAEISAGRGQLLWYWCPDELPRPVLVTTHPAARIGRAWRRRVGAAAKAQAAAKSLF